MLSLFKSSAKSFKPSPRKAIQKVLIPIDYDRSEAGFNNWHLYIRSQLHQDVAEGMAVIQGVNRILERKS